MDENSLEKARADLKERTTKSLLDEVLKGEGGILADIEWMQQEIEFSSLRDFATGYAIGMLKMLSIFLLLHDVVDWKELGWWRVPIPIIQMAVHFYNFEFRTRTKKGQEVDEKANALIRQRFPRILEKIERELNR